MNDVGLTFCTNDESGVTNQLSDPLMLRPDSSNKFGEQSNFFARREVQVNFSKPEGNYDPTPFPTLAAAYARVAMTTSMQKAYAIMRGTSDTSAGSTTGPLQDTLFERQDRETHFQPLHFLPDENTRAQLMCEDKFVVLSSY